ncbi:MAG TPA: GNAT family N-acetyltransferase [Steroidobacteraceae bacterium]|jgi:GNAT superfamily N-acetyltransferase|nr:GNAT family N-acetyltransferase [Steroidobacteraceae bacterium]
MPAPGPQQPRRPFVNARPAAPADIPQLLTLIERYWEFEEIAGFDAQRTEALLRRLFGTPALGAAWVAEGQGQLLGYVIVVQVLSIEHQGLMAEIDEFFVVPEARTRGVGTALLAALETALAGGGCVRLQLQLGVANRKARAFYQRQGFTARDGYELLDKPLPAHGPLGRLQHPRNGRS